MTWQSTIALGVILSMLTGFAFAHRLPRSIRAQITLRFGAVGGIFIAVLVIISELIRMIFAL